MTRAPLTYRLVCILALAAASMAWAAADEQQVPEQAVRDKSDEEYRAEAQAAPLLAERARRAAEAELRAKRIFNLPPDKVAAWAEGKMTEEELEQVRLPPEAQSPDRPDGASTPPPARLYRLVLSGVAVLLFGVLLWLQRRRQTPSALNADGSIGLARVRGTGSERDGMRPQ